MDIGMTEAVVFVYTLGVLFTGLWVADPTWPALTPVRIALLFVVSLVWTVYFSWTVKSRIVDLETEDDDEEEPGRPNTSEPGL